MRYFSIVIAMTIFCIHLLALPAYAFLSNNDKNLLQRINAQMRATRYSNALETSNSLTNKAAQSYINWKYLTANDTVPTYNQLDTYMRNNPNMPYQNILQTKLENTLVGVNRDLQQKFFTNNTPISTEGRVVLIDFLFNTNQKALAVQKLKKLWHLEVLSNTQQAKILGNYGSYLSPDDHSKRIRFLMDKNLTTAARGVLRYAPAGENQKIILRQKLMTRSRDALVAYQNAPNTIRQDAGVLRSLVQYYRKTNQENKAIQVMVRLTPAQSADNPVAWYESRSILSRVAFKAKMKKSAYLITSSHYLTEGGAFVDSEFYAGWLALRHLNNPKKALGHFKNGRVKSSLPISISRFEYWIGRSCDSLNDKPCGQIAYGSAGKYFYTFYGQLANHQLGLKKINIPKFPQPTPAIQQAYLNDSVIQAAYAAHAFGSDTDVRLMLTSVAERIGKHPAIYMLLEKTAKELGDLKTRVKLSKSASVNNDFLMDTGYPIITIRKTNYIPELALVYALTRQESEYDQYAQSPVGARGMMQLMPRTAQQTAREMRLPYNQAYLTQRPDYNMTLGGYYLNKLVRQFRGSYIHALSGYNAGPGRIGQWNQSYGYFSPDLYHIIDRIETIPFGETRNYIQRILESVQVYRAKMTGANYIATDGLINDLKRGL